MDYCDTNIITAFVNRFQLAKTFGDEGFRKFSGKLRGQRNINLEKNLKNLKGCVTDRKTLLSDIGEHQFAVGGILTSTNLKNIKVEDINGFKEGKKVYNKTCSNVDKDSRFYDKFCENGKLKNNLKRSEFNDVRHFGSAIKSNSTRFITSNEKDFKPLKNFTKVKIGGE